MNATPQNKNPKPVHLGLPTEANSDWDRVGNGCLDIDFPYLSQLLAGFGIDTDRISGCGMKLIESPAGQCYFCWEYHHEDRLPYLEQLEEEGNTEFVEGEDYVASDVDDRRAIDFMFPRTLHHIEITRAEMLRIIVAGYVPDDFVEEISALIP